MDNSGSESVVLTVGNGSFAGTIEDTGGTLSLEKIGSGKLTLTNNNTFSGGTAVNGGTLQVGNDDALGSTSGSLTVSGDSTLDLNGYSVCVGAISGDAYGYIDNSSDAGCTLTVGNGDATSAFDGTIENSAGPISLDKTGSGTLTLGGDNTYSGSTMIGDGSLVLGNADAVQNSTVTVDIANGLGFATDIIAFTVGGLAGSGSFALNNGGGGVQIQDGGNDADTTYSGVLSGDGSLVKLGSGTLTLTNSSNDLNGTTLDDGVLEFTSGALGTGTITFGGGTLQWASGNSENISGQISSIGSNAILDTNGNNVTWSHPLSGDGGLTKLGDGTLTLASDNSYSGTTTIESGTLEAASTGALPGCDSGKVSVAGGATLAVATDDGSGDGWSQDDIVALLSNANQFASGWFLGIDVPLNCTFSLSGQSGTTWTCGLSTLGEGTLTLDAAGIYSGGTAVDAGTLQLDAPDGAACRHRSGGQWQAGPERFRRHAGALSGTGTVDTIASGGADAYRWFRRCHQRVRRCHPKFRRHALPGQDRRRHGGPHRQRHL